MLKLDIKTREKKQDVDELRESGLIPAVLYGPGEKPVSISVPAPEFKKMLKEAGESTVVTLKTEDGEKDSLIHDVQFHPVTEEPLHADFYIFDKTKTVEVAIPVELKGVSPAVKDKGGILVKVLHEIKVEALPVNLPQEIIVDISSLTDFDSVIHAKDLKMGEGVELAEEADEVVVSVSEPREEEPEEEVAEEAMSLDDIEVEKKGKEEEEGEAVGDAEKSEGDDSKE